MSSEDQLIRNAIGGDRESLAAMLEMYGPQVRARLAARQGAQSDGEIEIDDVMQVTYLEAFLRIGQFENRGPGAFLAWLTQIAENNRLDALRALSRQKRPPAARRVRPGDWSESASALLDEMEWTTTTPSRSIGRQELAAALINALGRLPRDYATVLQRYDLEGLPVEEVAAGLGRSAGAVFMLRARALDRLREVLSGFLDDPKLSA
jgi:RNA polymerase sigma-70 factor (ECF subfamily)